MKTIILAGGWGTRLGRLTEAIPKPMVPIGGRPILWHIMKIYAHHGFDDFVIALGVNAQIIKSYFRDYALLSSDFTVDLGRSHLDFHDSHAETSWRVTLADTGLDTLKGGRLKRVEKYLDDDLNMLTYGDGLADIDLPALVAFHRAHGKILTLTGVHPPARFGELIEEDGRLVRFEEKPQTSVGLINGGYMIFDRRLFGYLTDDEHCDLEMGAFERLTQDGEAMVYRHPGRWECMDHERDVSRLNRLWKDGRAFWKVWD
jgi:glucose-1-phosphate cytidylyltransferase